MAGDEPAPSEDDEETPLEQIVAGAVIALTFLIGFGLMFAGFGFFWVAFVVGFAGILPMALGFVELYQRRQDRETEPTNEEDALEELRRRYARGELTDEEFERRVERLLETESIADARLYTERTRDRRRADNREHERNRDRERERNRDRERELESDFG